MWMRVEKKQAPNLKTVCPLLQPYQCELGVSAGIHPKLKVAGSQTHHGATLACQYRRGEESVCQAGAGRHCDQVRARSFLSIQSVYKCSQLLSVHFLEKKKKERN